MNVHIILLCIESDKPKLEKAINTITQLSIDIRKRFQSTKFSNAEKIKVQKFEKDFLSKMQTYANLLKQFQKKRQTELIELQNSVSNRRSTVHNQARTNTTSTQRRQAQQQQQSQQGVQIQLQDVNQQTLFQQHMMQLKQKQILQVKNKMQQALKVQKQVGKLVNEQGQQINIIQQNVDSARSNVKEAGNLLQQGVQNHMSANKKKCLIFGIIFICLIIIVVPIIVKVL